MKRSVVVVGVGLCAIGTIAGCASPASNDLRTSSNPAGALEARSESVVDAPDSSQSSRVSSTRPSAGSRLSALQSTIAAMQSSSAVHAPSKPKTGGPIPGPTDLAKPALGILNTRQCPIGRNRFSSSNLYQGFFGKTLYQVYAGTTSHGGTNENDLANGDGGVALLTEDPRAGTTTTVGIFVAPGSPGPLRVARATKRAVILTDHTGWQYSFDPATHALTVLR